MEKGENLVMTLVSFELEELFCYNLKHYKTIIYNCIILMEYTKEAADTIEQG